MQVELSQASQTNESIRICINNLIVVNMKVYTVGQVNKHFRVKGCYFVIRKIEEYQALQAIKCICLNERYVVFLQKQVLTLGVGLKSIVPDMWYIVVVQMNLGSICWNVSWYFSQGPWLSIIEWALSWSYYNRYQIQTYNKWYIQSCGMQCSAIKKDKFVTHQLWDLQQRSSSSTIK